MFLVLVVGGGLGWVSLQRQREARLKWVIATIEGLGASLDYDGIGISRIQWLGGNPNPASISRRALTASEIERPRIVSSLEGDHDGRWRVDG